MLFIRWRVIDAMISICGTRKELEPYSLLLLNYYYYYYYYLGEPKF